MCALSWQLYDASRFHFQHYCRTEMSTTPTGKEPMHPSQVRSVKAVVVSSPVTPPHATSHVCTSCGWQCFLSVGVQPIHSHLNIFLQQTASNKMNLATCKCVAPRETQCRKIIRAVIGMSQCFISVNRASNRCQEASWAAT